MSMTRTLPWDWYAGTIPDNVTVHESAFLETSYSFCLYRAQEPDGLSIGRGASIYNGTMFDVGPHGKVRIGAYAMLNPAWIICDAAIEIGEYALISWNVVLMDTYRVPHDRWQRRLALDQAARNRPRRLDGCAAPCPIRIERNVWIGFDSCVLPGVTIGEGSVIGARSVVVFDIPQFTVAAGNPARIIRKFTREEIEHGNDTV